MRREERISWGVIGVATVAAVGIIWLWRRPAQAAALPPAHIPTTPIVTSTLPGTGQPVVRHAVGVLPMANVMVLQTQLNALGYGPLVVDGHAGTATNAALRRALIQHLTDPGVIGNMAQAQLAIDTIYARQFDYAHSDHVTPV